MASLKLPARSVACARIKHLLPAEHQPGISPMSVSPVPQAEGPVLWSVHVPPPSFELERLHVSIKASVALYLIGKSAARSVPSAGVGGTSKLACGLG